MGEKDISEKMLADYNDVFADIINVLLFNGKCIGTVLSGIVSDVSERRHYAGRTEDDAGQSRE